MPRFNAWLILLLASLMLPVHPGRDEPSDQAGEEGEEAVGDAAEWFVIEATGPQHEHACFRCDEGTSHRL